MNTRVMHFLNDEYIFLVNITVFLCVSLWISHVNLIYYLLIIELISTVLCLNWIFLYVQVFKYSRSIYYIARNRKGTFCAEHRRLQPLR